MSASRLLCIAAIGFVCACGGGTSLRLFTPPEVDARSREYIAQFARGQIDSVTERLLPSLRGSEANIELQKMAAVLHNARFDTVRVIGAQTNTVNGVRHVNLTYELHSSSGWLLANVASVDSSETWFVEGTSARTLAEPLEVTTAFAFAGKSMVHYFWLVAAILFAVVSVGSALFLATQRAMPKRWRWVLFSLVGVGAFRLNWATGATSVGLLQVQFASAGVMRAGAAAPWILSFALPVGAFFGLSRYRRWRFSNANTAMTTVNAPEAAV